jgi:hypothetical protein
MHLFTYWETPKGSSKPGYISVCEETITKHCSKHFRVRHLDPIKLRKWLPDITPNLEKIRYNRDPAHTITAQSNYIRVALLNKYGGVWLDSDTLVLRDFEEVYNALHNLKKDFVYSPQWIPNKRNHSVGACFMGAQKNGKVIGAYQKILDKLINKQSRFSWGDLGHKLLTPLVSHHASECYKIKEKCMYPIRISHAGLFFKEEKRMMSLIDDNTLCFTLYNSIFPKKFKVLGRTQLLTGKTVLSKAFRHSLGIHVL